MGWGEVGWGEVGLGGGGVGWGEVEVGWGHQERLCTTHRQMAMGQKPNRTSEHPNPTTKIGPQKGGEFTCPTMGSQNGIDHSQITPTKNGHAPPPMESRRSYINLSMGEPVAQSWGQPWGWRPISFGWKPKGTAADLWGETNGDCGLFWGGDTQKQLASLRCCFGERVLEGNNNKKRFSWLLGRETYQAARCPMCSFRCY